MRTRFDGHLVPLWLVAAAGCTHNPCHRPIDAYCSDCPDLDEVIARVEAGEVHPDEDVVVLQCAGGAYARVDAETWYGSFRTEDYSLRTGEIVRASVLDGGPSWCFREGVGYFGEVQGCVPECVLARHCNTVPCEVEPPYGWAPRCDATEDAR